MPQAAGTAYTSFQQPHNTALCEVMKVQFLYHPINDAHVAEKIIGGLSVKPLFSLEGKTLKDIDFYNDDYYKATMDCDVMVLLIGSTFHKIAPMYWFKALQERKGLFGIHIHTIPDEWDETRKKPAKWNTEFYTQEGDRTGPLCETYDLPEGDDGVEYIFKHFDAWCTKAFESAKKSYGIT